MEDTNQESGVSLDELANSISDGEYVEQEDVSDEHADDESQQVDESGHEEEQPEDDGLVDAEYEGKTYRVPTELKDALLRQADYTQKTQAIAEQKRMTEQYMQALQEREQALEATFEKAIELREIQARIAQFDNLDWSTLAGGDAAEAARLGIVYQQLTRQAAEKQAELQAAYTQKLQLDEYSREQLKQQGLAELKQSLPAFNEKMAAQIWESARSYGVTDAELAGLYDPRYVRILHDAMQWRNLQAKKPQAMKKLASAPRVIKSQGGAPKSGQQAALQRLKASGRVEDLAALL